MRKSVFSFTEIMIVIAVTAIISMVFASPALAWQEHRRQQLFKNDVRFENGTVTAANGATVNGTASLNGAVTIDDALTVNSNATVTGDATFTGIRRTTPTALAPTNEQHLTVSEGVYLVTTAGVTTNSLTITLAAPTTAGDEVTFIMASSATFTQIMDIVDSGNVALSAEFTGTADDVLTLVAPTTSVWVERSRSTN